MEQNISEAIRISLAEDNEEEDASERSNDASCSNSSLSSFSALTTDSSNEENEKSSLKKKKDILHRDIEKRRRERINRSLVRLKELVPTTKDSMKCNGNSRLQKAKLLEMTVEYLSTLSKPDIGNPSGSNLEELQNYRRGDADYEKKQETSQREIPVKTVIAESAKEIYLTGYKAATEHILNKLTQCYNISGKDLESLTNNIGLASEISIPNMVLVPPPSLKFEENNVNNYSDNDKEFHGSPIYQPCKPEKTSYTEMNIDNSVGKKEIEQSYVHSNRDNRRMNDPKPSSRSSLCSSSSGVYSSDENSNSSPILISCLLQDPVTAQYNASLLPLDLILPPDHCQSLPYTYLQKQGKFTMETVSNFRKAASSPPPPPPPRLHSVPRQSPSYKRHQHLIPPPRAPGVPSSFQSDHHNQIYTALKRKYAEDSQVSVIMNQPQPKRPPNLLPGAIVSSSASHLPTSLHPTSLPSLNMQQKLINNASYFRELGIRHEYNTMSGISRKNGEQGVDYDLQRDKQTFRGLCKTSNWLMKGDGWN